MFRFKPAPSRVSKHIDLETVRETLLYIRGDVASQPTLIEVADALDKAIIALDTAELNGKESRARPAPVGARFFANR